MSQTLVVTVDRTSTVSITKKEPALTTVVNESTVATSHAQPPAVRDIDVTTDHIHQINTARGPAGKDGKDGKDGEASIPAVLDGGNF